MKHRIEMTEERRLAGIRQTMSLTDNNTADLWRRFMQLHHQNMGDLQNNLIYMQLYDQHYFNEMDPKKPYEKWAAIEVPKDETVPPGMDSFNLPGGLYAVFEHKGMHITAPQTLGYIFGEWLPSSTYDLDHRPHLQVLDKHFKHEARESNEEIWVPVRLREE